MITLYKFGNMFGLPDPSPFVVKAEMLLKLSKLSYDVDVKGFNKAPKGKLPYINDDGKIVADSTFIRWHLEQKYKIDFDQGLTTEQKALAWTLEKMLEDHFYWLIVDVRWMDDQNFAKGPAIFFAGIPQPLRALIVPMIRRKVRRNLFGQGLGRHTKEERISLAKRDLDAVSDLLGDHLYLFGDTPCGADATLFAFMSGVLCKLFDTPIRIYAESKHNIVAYVERVNRTFFSE